ncbi:MAG: helix-turn-helix transcriptional regulator [Actinomycetota bacterium]|nr:helix-turn-helix transcriptional regulator [Actinomycetota bacterium]
MADRESAQRLKRVLRVAMSEKGIDGWEDLGLGAGVSPTTIENWIYGRTTPQAKQIRMVADFLRPHTSVAALEAAYEGIEPPEPPIVDVLRELAPDLHELVVILRAQADQAVLEAVRVALEERRRGRGALPEEPPETPSENSGQG